MLRGCRYLLNVQLLEIYYVSSLFEYKFVPCLVAFSVSPRAFILLCKRWGGGTMSGQSHFAAASDEGAGALERPHLE